MMIWMDGQKSGGVKFDGTFGSLLEVYATDSESTYQSLKPGVRRSYDTYIGRLKKHIGDERLDLTTGRDLKQMFGEWRFDPPSDDEKKKDAHLIDHLPRARFTLSVLKAAISFGVVCRLPGCRDFREVMSEMEFPTVPSRTWAPSAEQITAARNAAHAAGAHSRALVYALQFEATLRQWDIIGQWVALSDPRPSAILYKGRKWIGPMWSAINDNMVLKIKPTKTENSTGVEVTFDLSACPMVMEELERIPPADRTGPLIKYERTGKPYQIYTFNSGWRADFKKAGLPADMWNRDLRAGGVTEGGKSGASKDDRRKVAGHAREETTEIYDRDQLEAHRRVMKSRTAYRNQNKA